MVLPKDAVRPSEEKLDRMMVPWVIRARILNNRKAGGISGNLKRDAHRQVANAKRAQRLLEWA